MVKIRFAENSDIKNLKQLWRLCFGDDEEYIDFYYKNKFKPDQTVLLLEDNVIAAMLTLLPLSLSIPSYKDSDTKMLYAIATNPDYQGRGLASQLINYCNDKLKENKESLSVLVPANKGLFGFYYKLGYIDGFYIRQCTLTRDHINTFPDGLIFACALIPTDAKEYNAIRNNTLKDCVYIKYPDEDIEYQKKLSITTKADIYKIEFENICGCAVIERLSEDKIFIKEILLPDKYLQSAIKYIAKIYTAEKYIIRTPSNKGANLYGDVRAFAVCKTLNNLSDFSKDKTAYLAFAFD